MYLSQTLAVRELSTNNGAQTAGEVRKSFVAFLFLFLKLIKTIDMIASKRSMSALPSPRDGELNELNCRSIRGSTPDRPVLSKDSGVNL